MNILQLVSCAVVNGAVRHAYDLSCELAARGHRVIIAHRHGEWISQQPLPPGGEWLETSFKRRPSELRRVAAKIQKLGVDVMHSHNSSAHAFGALLSAFWKVPRVATSHRAFIQLHWRMADRIIAPSQATADFQRRVNLMPGARIDVIPNFISVARLTGTRGRDEVRRELGAGENTFVIITVGEVSRRKNQELLVRTVPDLIAGGLQPLVLLAGKCEDAAGRRVADRIRELQLSDHVRLMGPRSDVADLLSAADCFCLPSRCEVLPIALLEAMGAGLPVVATDTGGVPELVRDGVDGFIVKSGDRRALAAALLRLALEAGLRSQMGRKARERVLATYTPEVCVPRVVECYEKALRSAKRGR